jgi:hypothetical protein
MFSLPAATDALERLLLGALGEAPPRPAEALPDPAG